MRVAYLGNLNPSIPWTTETHVARAWRNNGHEVVELQEGEVAWTDIPRRAEAEGWDLFMWTRTGSLDAAFPHEDKLAGLDALRALGVPSAGFHLDRWWGLNREGQVHDQPFFRCDVVFTADGGHQAEFAAAGVNHVWMPPGVSEAECEPAPPARAFESDVVFVGNWRQGGYHEEWTHRAELVRFLQRTYRRRVKFWPQRQAIRGEQLRRLYASVKVAVGDSCLVPKADGSPMDFYTSDRCPETIGRGALLVHPRVAGIMDGSMYVPGEHFLAWDLGDWSGLKDQIDWALARPGEAQKIREQGRAYVLAHHTYEVRVRELVAYLVEHGWLTEERAAA